MIELYFLLDGNNEIVDVICATGTVRSEYERDGHTLHTAIVDGWDKCELGTILLDGTQDEYGTYTSLHLSPKRPSRKHIYRSGNWILSDEAAISEFKQLRNDALASSDWTQLADSPLLTSDIVKSWRQQIRDIPSTSDQPREWVDIVKELINAPPMGIECLGSR